jgi:hypothetical protein
MSDLLTIAKTFFFSAFFVPTELTTGQLAVLYKVLDTVEKKAKERKSTLRAQLLEWATVHGELTPKGHRIGKAEGHKIQNEHRQATEPNAEGIKDLLKDKGVDIMDAFDEVKTLSMNPSKVKHLVEIGVLEQAEVDELRSVTHALKVTLSKPLNESLKQITPILKEG